MPFPNRSVQRTTKSAHKSAGSSPRIMIISTVAVALIVLLALGTVLYKERKVERRYVTNFIQVIYGINTGKDLCINNSAKLVSDWEVNLAARQNIIPSVNIRDKSRMIFVKIETDEYRRKIGETPQKYFNIKDDLDKLYARYAVLHALIIDPAGTLPEFNAEVNYAASEYKQAAEQLKANLPPEMTEALKSAKDRYISLRNF